MTNYFNKYCLLFILFTLPLQRVFSQSTTLTGGDVLTQPGGLIRVLVKKDNVRTLYDMNTLTGNEFLTTHNYVDGFGRPLESVVEKVSINESVAGNLVGFHLYDGFGRETKSFLPYLSSSSNPVYRDRGDGVTSDAITEQGHFYDGSSTATYNGSNSVTNKLPVDSKPYVQTQIEESPMQRLWKQGSVGNGYQPDETYKKSVVYRFNNSTDAVKKWEVNGVCTTTNLYSDGDLAAMEAIDENGYKVIVFTDKMGRTILKRQESDGSGGFYDSYYVYDLAGNLSYVVPPKAVARLTAIGGTTWNVTSVPNLTFSYVYDEKGRIVQKKVPGALVIYMVYDPLDRIVLVQDGNMRVNNKWYYRKYDSRGNSVIEGIYTDNTNTSLSAMESHVSGQTCYGSSSTSYYEARTSGGTGYTNQCFPTSNTEDRVIYYFDDYDFDGSGTADQSYVATTSPHIYENTVTSYTVAVPTGVKKKIIGTSNWLVSYNFYDKWLRPVQTRSNNVVKTTVSDVSTIVMDFAGRVIKSRQFKSASGFSVTVDNTYSYDNLDRLLQITQQNDGGTNVVVAKYVYNAIGQLVEKNLHNVPPGSSWLQEMDFRYNIRGQLTSINDPTFTSTTLNDETNDLFGMQLYYDNEDGANNSNEFIQNTPQHTALLSGVKWRSRLTTTSTTDRYQNYLYQYDRLYRLTGANYKEKTSGSGATWTTNVNLYTEAITYDQGGNIQTLKRGASGSYTDDLTYNYAANADNNQLLYVNDAGTTTGFKYTSTSSSATYTYDDNGNLLADTKKGITLEYNEQNKLTKIYKTSSTNERIEYVYDGTGTRLKKSVYNSSNTLVACENYIDGFVVDNSNALKYFAMAEGRVRYSGSVYTYEYFIKDHQGNVRMSFEDNGSGVAAAHQRDDYYAFGMIFNAYHITEQNNKLYNAGSEYQDDLSVGEYMSTFYREYDPVLGRFNSVDPMADATLDLSIYHYAGNNPVNFNDPMGGLTEAPFDMTSFRVDEFHNKLGTSAEQYYFNKFLEESGDWKDQYLDLLFSLNRYIAGGSNAIALYSGSDFDKSYPILNYIKASLTPASKTLYYIIDNQQGPFGWVKKFLVGDYRFAPMNKFTSVGMVYGLYVEIVPNDPKDIALTIKWHYDVVSFAINNSISASAASKEINWAWNSAAAKVMALINIGKLKPHESYVRPLFETFFEQNLRQSRIESFLNGVYFGVTPNVFKNLSWAKWEPNVFQ